MCPLTDAALPQSGTTALVGLVHLGWAEVAVVLTFAVVALLAQLVGCFPVSNLCVACVRKTKHLRVTLSCV